MYVCVAQHIFSLSAGACCSNRMLHITSFTLNSYHINSIFKMTSAHVYHYGTTISDSGFLMAIIFSQFIFVLFLPTTFVLCFLRNFHFGGCHIYRNGVCVYVTCTSHAEIEDEILFRTGNQRTESITV